MRILILATHLNAGGIARYILSLTKGLTAKNHQVFVVTGGGELEENLKIVGGQHFRFNIRTKSEADPRLYWALGALSKLIKDKKIDVIHAQTRVTQVMATFQRRLNKTPYVSTCHGFYKPKLARRLLGGWGDKAIAISEAVAQHLSSDFKVPEEKIVLIHNGIDLNEFSLITEVTRRDIRKKRQPRRRERLVFVDQVVEFRLKVHYFFVGS